MSVTFGSVGDIIAVCGIVHNLAQALNEIKGSSAEYRAVVNELNSFEGALDEVKSLSGTFSPHKQDAFRQCLSSAEQCRHIIAPFLDGVKKYREYLEEGSSSAAFKKALYKARWHYSQRDAVAKLRSGLQAHTNAILISLSTANLSIAKDQEQSLGFHHVALQKTCNEQTNNTNDIRSHLATSVSLFEESKAFFQHVCEVFGLQQTHKLFADIRDMVRRSLTISVATYQTVLRLETRVMRIERPLVGEPWVFEDPLGRLSPVHMDFINSWEAFDAVLRARFRSLPGYSKIENGEYILEEPVTGADVDPDLPWEVAFIPGRRYAMSMLFLNNELDQKAAETSCPRCFSASNRSGTSNIVWYPSLRIVGLIIEEPLANTISSNTCGTSYRRITEIADTPGVDSLMPTRNEPEKKRRPGKIKQARRRHVSSYGPHHKYPSTQDEGKKRKATESSDRICDQIHHFKRVRLITLEIPSILDNSQLGSAVKKSTETGSSTAQPRSVPILTPDFTDQSPDGSKKEDTASSVLDRVTTEVSFEPSQKADSVHDHSDEDEGSLCGESVDSCLVRYEFDHGRRYHAFKAGWYLLPNDSDQQDIEEVLHATILRVTENKLFDTPLIKPKKALDVGCGTGTWCIDTADQYPESSIYGIDLSPIQPEYVPPNCRFVVDDLEEEECFIREDIRFSLIFARSICTAVKDWPTFLHKCFDNLESGGYLEVQDLLFDPIWAQPDAVGTIEPFETFFQTAFQSFAKCGFDLRIIGKLAELMRETGFEEVTYREYLVPVGSIWKESTRKDQGRLMASYLYHMVDGFSSKSFKHGAGVTDEERLVLISRFREEFSKVLKKGLIFKYIVVYGKKA